MAASSPQVVVVGAGLVGLAAIKELGRSSAVVTLVDQHNYTTFPPLLFEAAAALISPEDVVTPIRALLSHDGRVRFCMGRVGGVDWDRGRVLLDGGEPLSFDYLILAPGVVPAFGAVAGAARHALPLKSVTDAIRLRNRPTAAGSAAPLRSVRLRDGRVLAYAEWGDPAGVPVLEFRGLPSSRMGDGIEVARLVRDGVRRITVDRPGVGFSDPLPGRALLDWPDDVRALADTLELDRFGVVGTSGGVPYAAACCFALPGRITRAALVSGLGPMDRAGAWEGMNRGEARTMMLARRAPRLARLVVSAAVAAERHRPGTVYRGLMKALPAADRQVAAEPRVRESLSDSFALAFRQGVRGQVHDWGLIAAPWGFRPEDIHVPTHLYQGGLDDRVPPHHARHLAARLPACRLTEYAGEGHMLIFLHAEEVLAEAAGGPALETIAGGSTRHE